MKKYLLIASFVLLSVSLSGCSLMNSVSGKSRPAAKSSHEVAMNSLQTVLASGKAAKCGTITNVSGVSSESQMYIDTKGNRIRTITKVNLAGTTQISNGLKLNDKVYTWVEGAKEGFVLSTTQVAKDLPTVKDVPAPAPSVASPVLQADLDKLSQQTNTVCEAWKIDETMFKLPKGVKFVDQMAKLKEMTDKANATIEAAKAKQKTKK